MSRETVKGTNFLPVMSAHDGSIGHPALRVWGPYQVGLALQQLLVFGIAFEPAEQSLTGIVTHPSVGQAHCKGHEGREVIRVQLQTPGQR